MKNKAKDISQIRDKLLLKVCTIILVSQRKWATWMGLRFNTLPRLYRYICMGMFFLVMITASAFSIIRAFRPDYTKPNLRHTPMIVSPSFERPNRSDLRDTVWISGQVRSFERYMDSLALTANGRQEKARFLKAHPGLTDSVKRIKELLKLK